SAHPFSWAFSKASGITAVIFWTGKGSPITPVENGNTCSGLTPDNCAIAAQVDLASSKPCSPVQALALPELIIRKRIGALDKCSLQTVPGAAQNAFFVNTPATF